MNYSRLMFWGVVLTLVVVSAWIVPLDRAATEQVDAGLKRALVSFASARAFNAVISVAQGTEVAIEPAGIGVKLSVGQVLKPLNDIVEQFAHLMLAASIAFGIEKILISIGAYWMVSLGISVMAGACAYYMLRQQPLPTLIAKLFAVLVMIRFAMPLAIIGSDSLFHQFMAEDYAASQQNIELVSGQLSAMNSLPQQATQETSAWDAIKGWSSQHLDIRPQLTNLKQAAEKATEHTIKLMVIFLLQTLLLPVLLVLILWGIVKGAVVPSRILQPTSAG
jgi:hypothetical protein